MFEQPKEVMEPIESLELETQRISPLGMFPSNPVDGQIVGPFMWSSERGSWKAYYNE